GHVLSLSRMDRITALRHDAATNTFFLTVQPGLLLSRLREQLASRTFNTTTWSPESRAALKIFQQAPAQFFPPDPTETSASIGGMVSCNASGACSFAFGPTSAHIQALRVLLPDGSPIALKRGECDVHDRRFRVVTETERIIERTLPGYRTPSVKNAAGYRIADHMDMVDLFIGMEGTLGVITEIEIRLSPAPAHIFGFLAFLPDEASALKFVRALRGETLPELSAPLTQRPVAIEFFNSNALELLRHQKLTNPAFSYLPDLLPEHNTAIYTEYHGMDEETVSNALVAACDALTAFGGDSETALAADTPHVMEQLKKFRHALPEAVNLLISERKKQEPSLTKLGTDMSVPDSHLELMMSLYNSDLAKSGLESVIFGHIGDNHVHVNILPRTRDDYQRGKDLYMAWAHEAVRLGGSVSAEHGIGKLKSEFLQIMYGADGVEEMRTLKKTFDPHGILNPGNLFSM
ncbi:TPA: FAD-binding oxidoreductase, partial [Candidatus Sumerlaeota bacterium]|nr:FAD-binding oxidoreductase [Candidatus Sumerlaeota bacterium]